MLFVYLKGTVSTISSDHLCNDGGALETFIWTTLVLKSNKCSSTFRRVTANENEQLK